MRLVLHGGAAVNAELPPDLRFYADAEVCDIDLFSASEHSDQKTAHALRGLLEKRGLGDMRVHPAKHPGTHTLRHGDVVLADVTRITREEMRKLARVRSLEGHGDERIKPDPRPGGLTPATARAATPGPQRALREAFAQLRVPVAYMKHSMHLELARPAGFIERWRKVLPRLEALYAAHPRLGLPDGKPQSPDAADVDTAAVLDACAGNNADMVLVGAHAAARILRSWQAPAFVCLRGHRADVVVADVDVAAARFPGAWKWSRQNADLLFGKRRTCRHVRLIAAPVDLCKTVDVDGVAVGSADLVLQYLYADVLDRAGVPDRATGFIDALVSRFGMGSGLAGCCDRVPEAPPPEGPAPEQPEPGVPEGPAPEPGVPEPGGGSSSGSARQRQRPPGGSSNLTARFIPCYNK